MSATTTDKPTAAADFASEVVTRTPVHDVALPGGAGTLPELAPWRRTPRRS